MYFLFAVITFTFIIWFISYRYFREKIHSSLLHTYTTIFWLSIFFRGLYYSQAPFTKTKLFINLFTIDSYLLGLIAYFHICLFIIMIIEKISSKKNTSLEVTKRRTFIGLSILAPVINTTAAFKISYPITKHVDILDANLPRSLDQLKIGQLTDIHIGPTLKKDFLTRVCKQLMKEEPDLIFITGDIIDGHVEFLKEDLQPLKLLQARYGVFLIDGNHEYYWNIREWRTYFSSLDNITMLNNKHRTIKINNTNLMIAGVTDYRAHRFGEQYRSSAAKAIQSTQDHQYKILLAHRPKSCHEAQQVGFNLQVSGHTHGGQSFPFNFIVGIVHPYLSGLYNHKNMQLYVSNGTGYWGPSIRLGIPGEVSILTLKTKKR